MKAASFILMIMICVLAFQGGLCAMPDNVFDESAVHKKLTAHEAKRIMDDCLNCVVLDVRTEAEFQQWHIDGAVLIPHDEIAVRAKDLLGDKDTVILVYCRSGRRSAIATNELVQMGYTHVYDFGGLSEWPYAIVRDAE